MVMAGGDLAQANELITGGSVQWPKAIVLLDEETEGGQLVEEVMCEKYGGEAVMVLDGDNWDDHYDTFLEQQMQSLEAAEPLALGSSQTEMVSRFVAPVMTLARIRQQGEHAEFETKCDRLGDGFFGQHIDSY